MSVLAQPSTQRAIVAKRRFGFSIEGIARDLGLPPAAVEEALADHKRRTRRRWERRNRAARAAAANRRRRIVAAKERLARAAAALAAENVPRDEVFEIILKQQPEA